MSHRSDTHPYSLHHEKTTLLDTDFSRSSNNNYAHTSEEDSVYSSLSTDEQTRTIHNHFKRYEIDETRALMDDYLPRNNQSYLQ